MNLLGFNYIVKVAYGAASRETRMHCSCRRNIKGLIPVDNVMKYAPEDEALRLADCEGAAQFKAGLKTGVYQRDFGVGFIVMGNLALAAPDDPSPIPPFDALGFTNSQAIRTAASDHSGGWHFFAGTLD